MTSGKVCAGTPPTSFVRDEDEGSGVVGYVCVGAIFPISGVVHYE